jgi:transposase
MRQRPEITVVSRDRGGEYAKAATQGAPQALQCADRFPLVKNLTEATQLLLARCQAEIVAASKTEEPERREPNRQVISIAQGRPAEPAHVEKVRLARRAGRSARSQQVVELHTQGRKAKEIAKLLDLGERTVRRWLAAGTFPEAKKRREAGRVPLRRWHPLSSHSGWTESEMVSPSGRKSRNRATPQRGEPCLVPWKRSSKPR